MVGAPLRRAAPESGLSRHARKGVMQMTALKVSQVAPVPSIMKSA
jgi:hypothetical protein